MKKKIRYYIFIIVVLIIIGNLISFILNPSMISIPRAWLVNCLFSLALGFPMMKLSELIIKRFGDKIRWDKNPGRRVAATLGVVIVIAVIATFLINYIFLYNIKGESFSVFIRTTLTLLILLTAVVVFAFSLVTGLQFFKLWKEGLLKQQALERKALELQLEALKNQVNPHFLFNSLNTLTTLVPRDPDMAVQMIMHLSDSYRYILEQKDKKLAEWPVERKFVENYLGLQQVRFANNIKVTIADDAGPVFSVVPLAVHMLAENAIKHNRITKEEPLTLSIFKEDDYLVVRNNLQVRSTVEKTSNVGLPNISEQYEILSGRKVEVISDEAFFTVKLPCIYKPIT